MDKETGLKKGFQEAGFPLKALGTLAGMLLIGFAMAGMYLGDLGADPISILMEGVSRAAGLSKGMGTNLVNLAFFLFALLFNRRSIRWATLISVLAMGPSVDLGLWALGALLPAPLPFPARLLLGAASCALLGFAIGFYLSFDFGATPSDSVALWLRDTFHLRYRTCSWLLYCFALVVGWALGGTVGVVTLLGLVLPGLIADLVLARLQAGPVPRREKEKEA